MYDDHLRLISIDPGNNFFGISVWRYNPVTRERVLENAWSITCNRYLKKYEWMQGDFSDRALVQLGLKEDLVWLYKRVRPHGVVCESNFMSRFPAAYGALVEVVGCSVRQSILEYDPHIGLYAVDPISAKIAVGAKTKKGGKDDVQINVAKLKDVTFEQPTEVMQLSFDACDSIAIGYCFINQIESGQVRLTGWI